MWEPYRENQNLLCGWDTLATLVTHNCCSIRKIIQPAWLTVYTRVQVALHWEWCWCRVACVTEPAVAHVVGGSHHTVISVNRDTVEVYHLWAACFGRFLLLAVSLQCMPHAPPTHHSSRKKVRRAPIDWRPGNWLTVHYAAHSLFHIPSFCTLLCIFHSAPVHSVCCS